MIRAVARWILPRSRIVWHWRGRARPVALTFDDGPDPRHTPGILAALEETDVRATFFVIGQRAEKHPELVEEMARAGHEIANHSYSHPYKHDLTSLELVAREVEECNRVVESITGARPRLYRPPYGSLSLDLFRHCGRAGMRIVLWSFDTLDYSETPVSPAGMGRDVASGDIVLLHDSHAPTAELVKKGVPLLKQRGLRLAPVSTQLDETA